MKNLSPNQLVCIMICCLFSRLMTYTPTASDNAALIIISEIIATAIIGILVIPIILLYKKTQGKSVISIAFAKNRVVGYTVTILYLTFCLFALLLTTGSFTYSLQYCFSQTYATWAIIIVFLLATLYIASMELPAVARTATIVAFITILGILIVMLGFKGEMDFRMLNLAKHGRVSYVIKSIRDSLSRSEELVFLVILLPHLKSKPAKSIYSYLAFRLLITFLIFASVTTVLGEYALTTKLPFFSLSSYSKTSIIERFDAFFLLYWTMCAVIRVAIILICVLDCLSILIPKVKKVYLGAGTLFILGTTATLLLMNEKWSVDRFNKWKYINMIILVSIIPLVLNSFKTRYTKSKSGGKQ